MANHQNQTALITGASSGIGLELTKLFARDGYNLVLVASDEAKLHAAADQIKSENYSSKIDFIAKDLSKDGAAQELYNEVKSRNLQVDVLVNDAGVGEYGLFKDTDLQAEIEIIHLNVIALVSLTKLFIKDMLQRNDGKVLQVASIASFLPHPWLSVYAATKAFVLSFSESLQYEIKDSNVKMTILCPGATDTDFFNRAGAQESNVVQNMKLDKPEEVAQQGYDALQAGDKRVIVGFMNKAQVAASNVLPDSLMAEMANKQLEPADHKN